MLDPVTFAVTQQGATERAFSHPYDHLFEDGPAALGGQRYCINGAAFGGCIDANSDNKTEASLLAAKFAEDHYDEVFCYCARRLPSREDAQDATQEVFVRLVKSHALYEQNGKPLAYLFSDALFYGNTCHHHCDRDCADDDV